MGLLMQVRHPSVEEMTDIAANCFRVRCMVRSWPTQRLHPCP
jgi:hypothetical protein